MKKFVFLIHFLSIFIAASFGQAPALRGGGAVTIQYTNILNVNVPSVVSTVIRSNNTGHSRSNFGSSAAVDRRMTEMRKKNGDEKGHIIASQLGGPAGATFLWNLFPQSKNMNRNVGSRTILQDWCGVENQIAKIVRGTKKYVQYTITFQYGNGNPRPAKARVVANVYSENGKFEQGFDTQAVNEDSPLLPAPRPCT